MNVLTSKTLAHSQATVEEAKEFNASIDTETPQIALLASVVGRNTDQTYTAAVFFPFNATGSLERHRTYHAAYKEDAFDADFEVDYESGGVFSSAGDGCRHSKGKQATIPGPLALRGV